MTENEWFERMVDMWVRGFYAGGEHFGKPGGGAPLLQSEIEERACEALNKLETERGKK